MPEKIICWPNTKKSDLDEAEYLKTETEKIRTTAFKKLDEAVSIHDRVFKNICIFSIIDCFAQEYFNYPTSGLTKAFCDFVLKFQDYCDYLDQVEPVTLFYDYEPNIKKVPKEPDSADGEPEQIPEVSLEEIGIIDGQKVSRIIKTDLSAEILGIIRRDEGRKEVKNYRRNHRFIHLIYKMRSRSVHELSRMGHENKWEIEDGLNEPFYRDMVRLYEFEGNIVSENFYELVIPSQFIYELTKNTLSNYFDYCLKEQRHPFENNSKFKRPVELTWRDS